MNPPLLSLRGVRREFTIGGSTVVALRDVDLDIRPGEFLAITGPSGGGKSTLLAILGLLDTPSAGTYRIGHEESTALGERDRSALRSRTFGFVFQAFHLLDRRPARDSVEIGMLYQGVPRPDRERRADDALDGVGLRERAASAAARLSGGERQRVAVARAVAAATPVVLADEPTGNLDSATGERVLRELERLHRAGATVVVVTHSAELATRAERRVELRDGRLRSEPPAAPPMTSEGTADARHGPTVGRRAGADLVADALASLRSRTRESMTLVLAVATAVALLIVSLGLSASAGAQVSEAFDARSNREVTVTWQASASAVALEDAVRRTSTLDDVSAVAGLADEGPADVGAPGETVAITVQTAVGDVERATRSTIAWAPGVAQRLSPGTVIVGDAVARRLELADLASAPSLTVNGRRLGVVGVLRESARLPNLPGQILVSPLDAVPDPSSGSRELMVVSVPGGAAQVGRRIAAVIDPYEPDQYRVDVPVDPRGLRADVEAGVQAVLIAFTVLAAVIAMLTLTNALAQSVRARRAEFGLRRALGARPRDLGALVAVEAVALGFAGGTIGFVLALLAILAVSIAQRWTPVLDFLLAPLAVGGGVVLTAVASIVGVRRAARVDPATALREA